MKNGLKSILNKNVISIKYFNRNKWAFEILDKTESKLEIMEKSKKNTIFRWHNILLTKSKICGTTYTQ